MTTTLVLLKRLNINFLPKDLCDGAEDSRSFFSASCSMNEEVRRSGTLLIEFHPNYARVLFHISLLFYLSCIGIIELEFFLLLLSYEPH